MILNSYKLLDFGDGRKLEQFGTRYLIRPSSQAVSKPRFPARWNDAQAWYDEKAGWQFKGQRFESWQIDEPEFSMVLRLQDNGQVGIFPEHATYLNQIVSSVKEFQGKGEAIQLLNLFAYTGMCSIVAAKAGASVCHVDSSKSSLDWAKQNLDLNQLDSVRLIKEDALTFMRKEVKRNKRYHLIVMDPPSFSRFKEGQWALPDIIRELTVLCKSLLEPKIGEMFFTFHGAELNGEIIRNYLLDSLELPSNNVTVDPLCLCEDVSGRRIPASVLIRAKL